MITLVCILIYISPLYATSKADADTHYAMKIDHVIHKYCNIVCIHEMLYIARVFNNYGERTP